MVALLPGKRDMQRFVAADRQREQLANLFKQVLGRPVRIEIEAGGTGHSQQPGDAAQGQTDSTHAPTVGSMRTEREEALALPLVKEVLAVFEATLIETHLQIQRPAAEPAPTAAGELDVPSIEAAAMDSPDADGDLFDEPMEMED